MPLDRVDWVGWEGELRREMVGLGGVATVRGAKLLLESTVLRWLRPTCILFVTQKKKKKKRQHIYINININK